MNHFNSEIFQPSGKLRKSIEDFNANQLTSTKIEGPDFLKNVVNHLETTMYIKPPHPCAMILHHIYENMLD